MKRTLNETERQVRIVVDNYTGGFGNWSAGASVDGEITPFEVTTSLPHEAFNQIKERLESSSYLDDRFVPPPEKDKAVLFVLLKGIADTWDCVADIPDWRENEYIRGQLELVIETCRVVTDEEHERGDGDIDLQRDRITDWLKAEVWA